MKQYIALIRNTDKWQASNRMIGTAAQIDALRQDPSKAAELKQAKIYELGKEVKLADMANLAQEAPKTGKTG